MNMNSMFDSKKLINRFFRPVDGVVWDLMSGRVGVKTSEGIVTVEGEGEDAQVTINLMDGFGVGIPAFAQSTPVESIQIGDLIYGSKAPLGWVVEKSAKSFKLLKADGTRSSWTPPKVSMIGFDSGAMVMRNLINILPGGSTGLGGLQGMILPMMMMGGDMDLGNMLPMMLMSQMGSAVPAADGTTAPNPFAAMGGGGIGGMMQMMMMMNMMKGGSGKPGKSNSMFGGNFFDGDA